MIHIIYIPGLGDRYDAIRKIGLLFWRWPGVRVTHLAMRWGDSAETFEQKLTRIKGVIDLYPNHDVVLVGESAGGAASIVAMDRFRDQVTRLVTVCGMNHGASHVNPRLYAKNPAFQEAMIQADNILKRLSPETKALMLTVFSSKDFTVRPKNSRIDGVEAVDLRIPGHMVAILAVLFVPSRTIKTILLDRKY